MCICDVVGVGFGIFLGRVGMMVFGDKDMVFVVGGLECYVLVFLDEVFQWFDFKVDDIIVDGIFGVGGYLIVIFVWNVRVVGIDRDFDVIVGGQVLVVVLSGCLILVLG